MLWAASAGCAFTTMPLTLPTDTPAVPRGLGQGRQVIVIPFTDDRTIWDRCGMKKNGYNMDTADAVCSTDPAEWLTQLLTRGLSQAGFETVAVEGAAAPDAIRVDGTLKKLFVEPVIGAWTGSLEADIQVDLVATTERGLQARRSFFSKGIRAGQVLATSGPFQLSLRRASEEIVRNMVEAIAELAREFPAVAGTPPSRRAVALNGWRLE